jgi:hypothetical protein
MYTTERNEHLNFCTFDAEDSFVFHPADVNLVVIRFTNPVQSSDSSTCSTMRRYTRSSLTERRVESTKTVFMPIRKLKEKSIKPLMYYKVKTRTTRSTISSILQDLDSMEGMTYLVDNTNTVQIGLQVTKNHDRHSWNQ